MGRGAGRNLFHGNGFAAVLIRAILLLPPTVSSADPPEAAPGFWRESIPELKERGELDRVARELEAARTSSAEDPEALIALAELRMFQGRFGEAEALFWRIFALPGDGAVDAREGFARLNAFHRDRLFVKYRIGLATGRYGSRMALDYSFLGFTAIPPVRTVAAARDLSLLYLRELWLPERSSETLLKRVKEVLAAGRQPIAERILAFGGLAAPASLLETVEDFVATGAGDEETAELALRTMNRYVRALERFPDLRRPMIDLAVAMEGGSETVERVRLHLLRRLDAAPPDPDRLALEKVVRAAEESGAAEGERLYRSLAAKGTLADRSRALLFLADRWLAEGDAGRAAALAMEHLEPICLERSGDGFAFPLDWTSAVRFPPANPYLGRTALERIREVFEWAAGSAAEGELTGRLAARAAELAGGERAGAVVALAAFHVWAGNLEAATELAEAANLTILTGYLLGLEGRLGDARERLAAIQPEEEAARAADRLSFALAVAAGERETVIAAGGALDRRSLTAGETVAVAAGLFSVGALAEADRWLARVSEEALSPREIASFRSFTLRVALARGDAARVESLAREVLLGEDLVYVPTMFGQRRVALDALAETQTLAGYRAEVEARLAAGPASVSTRLLLGEAADHAAETSETGGDVARREALEHYREAVGAEPFQIDLRLDFCRWLTARGFWEEAAERYRELLDVDAQAVLLGFSEVLHVFERTGRTAELIDCFEDWAAPDAWSMDAFYGLQPTAHLFLQLGEALLRRGDSVNAARAWEKGVRMNPVAFTDAIRAELTELYRAEGRTEEALTLLREYVCQANPDPALTVVQPFAAVAPQWVKEARAAPVLADAPVERLIVAAGNPENLSEEAKRWAAESPDLFSAEVFVLYLLERAGSDRAREERRSAIDRWAERAGPAKAAWPVAAELLDRRAGAGDSGIEIRARAE